MGGEQGIKGNKGSFKKTLRNRLTVSIFALAALYLLIRGPHRSDSRHKKSGIHRVTGNTHEDAWELGRDTKGKVVRANHGDDDDVCFHYDGILLISYADEDGFATVFFLFVLNQLLYAEKHNLLPWIHLDGPTNKNVYDPKEHNPEAALQLEVTVLNGLEWDTFEDKINRQSYQYPGKPILDYKDPKSETKEFVVDGSGIWSSYFDPPSRLEPIRHLVRHADYHGSTCHKLPIFQLSLKQIEPSLMVYAPWAVRAWRRKSMPPSLASWNQPYQDWFDPMRRLAHQVIRDHYHPTEEMTRLAHQANPVVASEDSCLALHIRWSDKSDRREPIALSEFKPYVEAYIHASLWVGTHIHIYVATDSNQVLKQIELEWPKTITRYLRFQENILRSNNATAVFAMTEGHHKTNTEVFTDILAMAECEFMVHGMSAVTEAVHYLNLRLHNQSVNLEEETTGGSTYIHQRKSTMTSHHFEDLVRNRLHKKRKEALERKKKEELENLGPRI